MLERVPVHSICGRASCWQLTYPCEQWREGGRQTVSRDLLMRLGREHSDFWRQYWVELGEERRKRAA
jgi:hypothetical protein